MSVECMTSKSKSGLDSLEGLSVKLHLQRNLCVLTSVGLRQSWGACFECLQLGLAVCTQHPRKGCATSLSAESLVSKWKERFFSGLNRDQTGKLDKIMLWKCVGFGCFLCSRLSWFLRYMFKYRNSFCPWQVSSHYRMFHFIQCSTVMSKVILYLKSLWTQCCNSSLVIEYLLPCASNANVFFPIDFPWKALKMILSSGF